MNSKLTENGFIHIWQITNAKVSEYHSNLRSKDQLQLEKEMRKDIVSAKAKCLPEDFIQSQVWKPYYSFSNIFVDSSAFHSNPIIIRFNAKTELECSSSGEVVFALWSYMSLALYVNGKLAGSMDCPCYKPIRKETVKVFLEKGVNTIVVCAENLGVRDSNNVFALQVLEGAENLSVRIDRETENVISFLDNLTLSEGKVCFPFRAPEKTIVTYPYCGEEWQPGYKEPFFDVSGQSFHLVQQGVQRVCVSISGMKRTLELTERIQPLRYEIEEKEERFRYTLSKIAKVRTLDRGDHGFSIFNILARKAIGQEMPDDAELLNNDIELIRRRVDCSDFILSGVIRYAKNYFLDTKTQKNFKDALLSYRYWMDMEGQDCMCFWSENHSLMFYTCGYLAGRMYPDDLFSKANMSGNMLAEISRGKLTQWLDDVLLEGFEEFQSAVYMCVTFAALLNVYDYAEKELAQKAGKILSRLLSSLAIHVFDGAVISPMGRVYRGCIYPFQGAANSMLALQIPNLCYDYAEGWVSFFATSSYRLDENLSLLSAKDQNCSYSTGNAEINLLKTKDYLLTSVSSPRTDGHKRWINTILSGDADISKHSYTKSMNECFHGTSFIQPGAYGYQQHLWYAALSNEAVIFLNHPGTSCETTSLRPGYWHGNGVFPALKQEEKKLYGIYALSDTLPIAYIHSYIPKSRFDEVKEKGNWIFLRKREGYIALWTSEKGYSHDDFIKGCELRYNGPFFAFHVIMGSQEEDQSFEKFIAEAMDKKIAFEYPSLYDSGKEKLTFRAYFDKTQIVD